MPDRPLRFLIGADVPPDPNSGAAGTVYWTNQALRELGHEVDEIWRDDLHHRIKHGNLHYLLELPKGYRDAVRQRCAKKEYDVIMLSQPHAWLAAKDHKQSGRPGVFINRSHGVENMVDDIMKKWQIVYGVKRTNRLFLLPSLLLNRLLRRSFPMICRYTDGIVVGAQDNADYIVNMFRFPRERIKVVTHGIGQEFFSTPPPENHPSRFRRILYVGQFAFVKAPQVVAEVFSRLAETQPDIQMTWVCAKQHHADVRLLLGPKSQNRVNLLGWVPQNELVQIFDRHGVFLFPSFFEGCGKAPLEAMSRGLCVVASNVGGMVDIIRHKSSGFLVDTGSIAGFTDAVRQLLNNINMSRVMGNKAREATQSISWLRVARDVCDFVDCIRQQEKSRQVS